MITLATASLLVDAIGPARADIAAHAVAESGSTVTGLARFMPAALRRRIVQHRESRHLMQAARRLDELSPHLLADIGLQDGTLGEAAEAAVIIRVPASDPVTRTVPVNEGSALRPVLRPVFRPVSVRFGRDEGIGAAV